MWLDGSVSVTDEAKIRSPDDPVSTKMSEIVWQVEVPGWQMVIWVQGELANVQTAAEEGLTVMVRTLESEEPERAEGLEPPELPQPSRPVTAMPTRTAAHRW
jgi:hypothetical protein